MKKIFLCSVLVVLLTSAASAQLTTGWVGATNDDNLAIPDPHKPVLLAWQTYEKCYECNFRYLLACTGSAQECEDINVPMKTVIHWGWFGSEKEALATAETRQWDVAGLWVTVAAGFKRTEEEKHEPQPDRVTTVHHYTSELDLMLNEEVPKKGGTN